ncbi:MAG: tetratricopeptide repeat protein [Verrucomicrobiota bacterium]
MKSRLTKPSNDFLLRKVVRLKRAIARNPTSAILHQGLGRAYTELKCFKEARTFFVKSLELDPSDLWTNLYLGNSYFREGDYPRSLEYFDTARSLDSKVAMPLVCQADTFHKLGEDEKADCLYKKAVNTDPECNVARRNLERWQQRYRAESNDEQGVDLNT